ncbi:hypothetical protein D9758_001235 [Tetrapyrgos nigripes]|uniref:C2 domain-containing protein n=1 Tax=Tetrapyrgos nigripes TaxID=182062 RepID=A0A8H5GRK9_9AGAR|nr:hypothetical protein D9758_001235 [Tetrapyrgos nigripes]
MSSTPREIGTLVVVILKANHLPNKRHIGKQDPYCAVTFNGETKRTKALKRGGQHPEWDEEVRFTIYEDVDPLPAGANGTPPPLPPKDHTAPKKVKGGNTMKLACYADDIREPDFIGDSSVDLREVLTKGETDEWYTLMAKDRFAGKVYLEMTFWSNEPEPPPKKKATQTIPKNSQLYAGPGSFVEHPENGQSNRVVSTSALQNHSRRQSDSYSSYVQASTSLAGLDLYQAPYENQNDPVEALSQNFSEFGVAQRGRRESSLPLPQSIRRSSSTGFSSFSSQSSQVYESTSSFYDRPVTPTGPSYHQSTISSHQSTISSHPSYTQPPYQHDQGYQPQPQPPPLPPSRGPRFSIPASSSGFVPLPSSSSFVSSESSGFTPSSHTPAPGYEQSHFSNQTAYPPPSQTPLPPSHSQVPQSSSFVQMPDSYYPTYGTVSAPPPQQYIPSHALPVPGHLAAQNRILGTMKDTTKLLSRLVLDLGPPAPVLPPFPVPPSGNQHYSPSHIASTSNGIPSIPPPPPLPSSLPVPPPRSRASLPPSPQSHSPQPGVPLPAPPPPPPQFNNTRTPIRRASLPQPPPNPPKFQPRPSFLPHPNEQYAIPESASVPQLGQTQYPRGPLQSNFYPQDIPPPPPPPSVSGTLYHPDPAFSHY